MHEFTFFNQNFGFAAKNSLSAVSAAALYGKGIFTTVAVADGKPFLWEKHWRRLNENAAKLQIDLSAFSEKSVKAALDTLIKKNNFTDGRARITFFDEAAGKIWNSETDQQTNLLIITADLRAAEINVRLCVSPYLTNSTSPLAAVKSCNYLENILALAEAEARGFNEAVRLNERGEIVAACMANIFWAKNGKLFTPSLETGCLPGTTRELLIENFEVAEIEKGLEILESADAIFLTSAGIGITQITALNKRIFSILKRAFQKENRTQTNADLQNLHNLRAFPDAFR